MLANSHSVNFDRAYLHTLRGLAVITAGITEADQLGTDEADCGLLGHCHTVGTSLAPIVLEDLVIAVGKCAQTGWVPHSVYRHQALHKDRFSHESHNLQIRLKAPYGR